jgi:hypothetical protein
MYDADNLYILARFTDETPLNNPGQTIADYGFSGDCLPHRQHRLLRESFALFGQTWCPALLHHRLYSHQMNQQWIKGGGFLAEGRFDYCDIKCSIDCLLQIT